MPTDTPLPLPRYRLETIALGILAARLLLSLVGNAVRWDWLFDTGYLLVGLRLLLISRPAAATGQEAGTARPLDTTTILLLYLTLDGVLRSIVAAVFPSLDLLAWPALAYLYGRILFGRLACRGVAISRLPWSEAARGPDRLISWAAVAALCCLYLPMLRLHRAVMITTSPLLLTFRQAIAYSPGRMVDVGGTYTYRGVEIAFSRAAALLLAGVAVVRVLQLAELMPSRSALSLMRGFAISVSLWWLFVAQGFRSLDHLANLIFTGCCCGMLVLLFRRAKV